MYTIKHFQINSKTKKKSFTQNKIWWQKKFNKKTDNGTKVEKINYVKIVIYV